MSHLSSLLEASKLLNATLDRDEVLRRLITLAARGTDADRATLYLLEKEPGELCSIVALEGEDDGASLLEIHLPLDEGLAGYVAQTGETLNVADAYTDPRFSPRIDQETGYRTQTLLTVPMCDPEGEIIGVVQAINKDQGQFTEEDQGYLLALAEHAALTLKNADLHAALLDENRRLSFLCRISNLIAGQDPENPPRLQDVLLTVMQGITDVMAVESSAILLWDRRRRRLAFVTVAGPKERELKEIDVPLEGSIAGWVVQNEQAVIVNDVQSDPRFYPKADEATGLVTHRLIGVPISLRGVLIGVLEVVNKHSGAPFDQADLQLAQAVANHAASAIDSARHYESLLRVGEHHERRAVRGLLDPLNLFRG
jgi:adenylate cyclase